MNIEHSVSEFADWIGEVLRFEIEETEETFIYTPVRFNDVKLVLSKQKLQNEIDLLSSFQASSDTILSTDKTYEIIVREESPFFRFTPRPSGNDVVIQQDDEDNHVSYTLGRPSNEFVLYLVQKAALLGEPRALYRSVMSSSMMRRELESEPCILDLLRKFVGGRMSLKVTSNAKKSTSEFERFSTAFLFNISYNTDTAFVQQRDFEELLRTGRITRNRRQNIEEIDPPRRSYIPDLIHHYQLAIGTENPMLEYISFYHIAEHFFEAVFTDALVEKVRNKITHADFSYRRKKDISSLIKEIGNSIKLRDDSFTFNEREGLRLTLERHVNLDELKNKLNEYDSSLVEYYKLNVVSFSGAGKVDLNGDDEALIFKHLANRIYKNRNSIVHSKDSEKSKYTPFKDDGTLVKEVPLLRFVSEQIIFETSSVI